MHNECANVELDVHRGPRCQLLRQEVACSEPCDERDDEDNHDYWREIGGFCVDGF